MKNQNDALKQLLQQSLGISTGLIGGTILFLAQPAQAAETCAFDPASGKPNPLGMRAFVTVTENNGDTSFVYEQFPSNVGASPGVAATIANRRELTMFATPLAKARQLMLDTPTFFNELMGSKDSEGFAAINAVLTCKPGTGTAAARPPERPPAPPPARPPASPSESPKPAPKPGPKPATEPAMGETPAGAKSAAIADLADGTYRYWNGIPTQTPMTDDELVKAGGALFLFEKKGREVRGFFGAIDADPGACIRGSINGNTVAGFAYPQTKEPLQDPGDKFVPLGTSNFLRVRRLATDGRGRKFYSSALLDLSGFGPVSLGDRELGKVCRF